MSVQRSLLAIYSLILATADAGASAAETRSATLGVQGDELGNREWLGKLAFSLGEHAWVQGTFGRTDLALAGAGNRRLAGAAFGLSGQTFSAAVEFAQRSDDARFKQQTWVAALDWRGVRGGFGVDALARSTDAQTTQTMRSGGAFSSPVSTTIKESANGTGFGIHGDWQLTARASIVAGLMRYRYDFDLRSDAAAPSSPLSSLLGLNAIPAGVWREQAFIDRSYRIGGKYHLQHASIGAQYFRDRVARSDATSSTWQLQADLPVGEHWLVSPLIGYSSGVGSDATGYGGLSLNLRW
ncbi:hypothetical protein JM946_09240 [Steroidobacter sp. S1-65]|uniref:Autotransporter domain-containing protein n=1 Tax=Steroidobacter gossypii TaxID=2805490 RepID=A0ABS1WVE9_9GAMM|nr:hypothetical protein [Steroidobacter gossypii]MBM0104933.1 hypothetical protein [Steroidobacter gossypii]